MLMWLNRTPKKASEWTREGNFLEMISHSTDHLSHMVSLVANLILSKENSMGSGSSSNCRIEEWEPVLQSLEMRLCPGLMRIFSRTFAGVLGGSACVQRLWAERFVSDFSYYILLVWWNYLRSITLDMRIGWCVMPKETTDIWWKEKMNASQE